MAMSSLLLAASGQARAEDVAHALTTQVQQVFAQSQAAVVKIEASDEHGKLSGSGFIIDPQGTIYTSYTIGGESNDIVVTFGKNRYPATRLIGDSRSGIAILKIEAATPFLKLGRAEGASVATPVLTVAYPMDLPVTPSLGLIAGFELQYRKRLFATTHIRTTVPVQRGQGGGPLLNLKGEVMGILISSIEGDNGCFVLPIEAAEKVRMDYLRFGEVRPGWIGIDVKTAALKDAGSSAEVGHLIADAPASKSGLQPGDVLLQVGKVKITSPEDVLNASFYLTAGDSVPLTVSRSGEIVRLHTEVGEHPFKQKHFQAFGPVAQPKSDILFELQH